MLDARFDCPCCSPVLFNLFSMVRGNATGSASGLFCAAETTGATVAGSPDRIRLFHGGTILTVNAAFSEAEAIAVKGDRIIAVGKLADVQAAAGPQAERIDLEGHVMLPGFVEPHTHMMTGSLIADLTIYVGASKFARTSDVLDHLKQVASQTAPGEWIVARNFDPSLQEGPEALTFAELDAVSTRHPIFILNSSLHLAYANRAAFAAAGLGEDVENPQGAEFVRDGDGRLTGTIKNNVAYLKILSHYPAFRTADPAEALIRQTDAFSKLGLTTLSDLGMGGLAGIEDWNAFLKAAASGKLHARMRVYPFYTQDKAWDDAGLLPGAGNPHVRVAGYKLIADGSNQGFTGLQRDPYLHSETRGLAYMSPEEMTALMIKRGGQGFQISVHGNGDRAIDNILDSLEAAQAAGVQVAELRPRIEHCSILHDDQIDRLKALGVSPSFLIGHVYYWGVAMRDLLFGAEKVQLLDRCKSVEDAGIGFTIHSDFLVTDPDPLLMIQTAVTRKTWKEPDFVVNPDERVSVETAIRAMTSEAAWQLSSEHEIGSLETGKFADMVILEEDPRKVDPDTIKDIKVLETWMGGQRVYAA
ncbi:amidohydrolase [Martelella alba]|uniref:Amidohydrolase n=1 Tax=Martelella alba TaxID=2590451 RepID=A0A506U5R0_9HYPH|nr:amidohydrolase [Martelella alba]TPW29712.1 amidohydrolase [Martelella alba]